MYEIGILKFDSGYNFFRDETCSDLNPCKVFYTEDDRNREIIPFYRVESTPLKFKNGKMVIGSLNMEGNGSSIAVMRYRPGITYPTEFVKKTELGKWEKYLQSSPESVNFDVNDPITDAIKNNLQKGEKCLQVRGCIVRKMVQHIPNFNLRLDTNFSIQTGQTTFVVDSTSKGSPSVDNKKMYTLRM